MIYFWYGFESDTHSCIVSLTWPRRITINLRRARENMYDAANNFLLIS